MTRDFTRVARKLRVTAQALDDAEIRGDDFYRANYLSYRLRTMAEDIDARAPRIIEAAEALVERHAAEKEAV